MATPSMLQAATSYNWVSSIDSITNVHKPEIASTLYKRYGNQNMTGFLRQTGALKPISAIEYFHFEEDWLHAIVKVQTQGGGAAGATVTLTIATSPSYTYAFPATAQSPYLVTGTTSGLSGNANLGTASPVRLQDTVVFPDGTKAIVTAVTALTFDVTPIASGVSIPATTTNVTEIAIYGNAHAEGSDQPKSMNSRLIKYSNALQIQKGNHTVTGTEMGVRTWIEVEGVNGQKGYLWYFKGQFDEENRFDNYKEITNIVGSRITNTTLASIPGQETVTTTNGLITDMENNANNYQYSAITGITLADWEIMIATQLDKNRGAKENTVWEGINFRQGVDRFMRDTMKNGGISYGAFNGNKEKAIDFGFDSFQLTGYTFHHKIYDVFNYPQMLGAAGQPYPNVAMLIPADKMTASFGDDKKKESVPAITLNYLKGEGNNYSREKEMWITGGVNGVYTENIDRQSFNMRSHVGFESYGLNRFVLFKNA